ncbi:hypothetical protein ACIPJM_27795 [Streptomyces halstedii]|uniref:hypothetical protein n=1 Tax=Streptomyces halstedii TaxID=1944 RepID=UPI00380A59C8
MPPALRMTAREIRAEAQRRLYAMKQAQLEIVRQQAEGWRNFLGAATALLAAVLVLKGRENVAELPAGFRFWVVGLVAAGLLALLSSAFTASTAAHGRPGEALKAADGAALLLWEGEETERAGKRINRARWLAVLGVLATAGGVMLTWVAPAAENGRTTISVRTTGGTVCGDLVTLDAKGVTVKVKGGGKTGAETQRRLEWGSQAMSAEVVDTC